MFTHASFKGTPYTFQPQAGNVGIKMSGQVKKSFPDYSANGNPVSNNFRSRHSQFPQSSLIIAALLYMYTITHIFESKYERCCISVLLLCNKQPQQLSGIH